MVGDRDELHDAIKGGGYVPYPGRPTKRVEDTRIPSLVLSMLDMGDIQSIIQPYLHTARR
jgi:hypothetical protein